MGAKENNGDLGFTAELFKAADRLRGNLEPSEYKHVALGLIFLKYISNAFDGLHAKLAADKICGCGRPGGISGRECLLRAEGSPLGASSGEC